MKMTRKQAIALLPVVAAMAAGPIDADTNDPKVCDWSRFFDPEYNADMDQSRLLPNNPNYDPAYHAKESA